MTHNAHVHVYSSIASVLRFQIDIRNIWGGPISLTFRDFWGGSISVTLTRCKQCETSNNACEDQNNDTSQIIYNKDFKHVFRGLHKTLQRLHWLDKENELCRSWFWCNTACMHQLYYEVGATNGSFWGV